MLLAASLVIATAIAPAVTVIPKPLALTIGTGEFVFDQATAIVAPADLRAARHLRELMAKAPGLDLKVSGQSTASHQVVFEQMGVSQTLGKEAYTLHATPSKIVVEYSDPAGAFYAVQTIRQLLPAKIDAGGKVAGVRWSVPAVTIRDKPRFSWRGMHLDVSRHYFDTDFIKEYIDWIAMMKMNVFHWHLVDDGGWRMEVKKYPKLTEIGAWRIDTGGKWPGGDWNYSNIRFCMTPEDGPRYGGYYTQDEIREIVRYAADRHIEVVPEIELPGHSLAVIAAYPELGCQGLPPGPKGRPASNAFCGGLDASYTFLEDVLKETLDLFPSKFVHIGADELDKRLWQQCPRCKAKLGRIGAKDMDGLQSYMVRYFDNWLATRGRRLVGWDEIIEGGLADGATVMSWRGSAGGIEAAKQGKHTVMSPTTHCYFDYSYLTISTEHVYSWNPVPKELTGEKGQLVLGGQANVWTEFIATEERCEEMVFPRALAMAEVLWSDPKGRNWDEFSPRLNRQFPRLNEMGVRYHLSTPDVEYDAILLQNEATVKVRNAAAPAGVLRYTTDGTTPNATSPQYNGPIPVGKPKTLTFAFVWPDGTTGDLRRVEVMKAPAKQAPGKSPGLLEEWFAEPYQKVGTPLKTKPFYTGAAPDPNKIPLRREDEFFVRMTGKITIQKGGVHTFWLTSDDGSILKIGGATVVDNDGAHAMATQRGRVLLPAGTYSLQILWSELGGDQGLRIDHQPPGSPRNRISTKLLSH
ncbi:MAG: family 20 glycosylhydrolase [Fimbriimonadaceae bacterium]